MRRLMEFSDWFSRNGGMKIGIAVMVPIALLVWAFGRSWSLDLVYLVLLAGVALSWSLFVRNVKRNEEKGNDS